MHAVARAAFAAGPPLVAATVGAISARDAPEVYARLGKPTWAPPAGLFGPVWSALYSSIGVVGWRASGRANVLVLASHVAQLALNASWTPLFFAARRRKAALVVAVALDAAVAAEMAALTRSGDRRSAALLAPYLAWCGFATALTAAVSDPLHAGPYSPR